MAIFPGTTMDDVLMGTEMDDVLWGGPGDDELSGGAGNDRLIGGPGADSLAGGPGIDVASYTDSMGGVHVDLGTSFRDEENPPVRGGDAEGDALTGIEDIWGSNLADRLIGGHGANRLFGNGGNDAIIGGRGNDLLRGGDDNDVLGATGNRDDPGHDTLYGDAGIDSLNGGTGNDMLFGGVGADVLEGGMGDDLLEGGMGADELMGGGGMDTAAYTMSTGAVTVDLSVAAADATAEKPRAAGGDAAGDMVGTDIENLRGSMHDDMLTGDGMANKLFGNMGDDMLKGMGGDDTLHGGKGMDTLYGGMGDDTLRGEMGDDVLKGEEGDDTLIGGPGADKLFGHKFDADTMMADNEGDSMGDVADYGMSDAGVTIDLSETTRTMPNAMGMGGHAEGDELAAIEHLTGSMHDDELTGTNDRMNTLKGMDGNDMLSGKGGDDKLEGGDGMDTLDGGAGADMLMGGDGDDTFVYRMVNDATPDDDADTTDLDESRYRTVDTDGADAGTAAGDPVVSGGAGMDTVDASRANEAVNINLNVMRLLQAPDVDEEKALEEAAIYTGIEKVMGGEGADTLVGNAAAPTTLMGGGGNDTLTGGSRDDTLEGGSGADSLVGGDGSDMLEGGSAADTLLGGAGADTLAGGAGDDMLTGGTGRNVFVYDSGDDEITDFKVSRGGGDTIDLSALDLTETDLERVLAGAENDGTDTYLKLTGDFQAADNDYDIKLTGFGDAANEELVVADFII